MLRSSRHVGIVQSGDIETFLERLRHLRNQLFPFSPTCAHLARQRAIVLGFKELEREILELPSHLCHAEAMRERRVDVTRLLRNESLFVVGHPVQRPHVVQAVGELDDDHAGVARHGQQQLPIRLSLALFLGREREIADLRQAVDDLRDLRTELTFDVGHGDRRVLDHIVNQSGGNRGGIQLQIGQNARDLHAVHDIVLA